jgi:hypothetical protein
MDLIAPALQCFIYSHMIMRTVCLITRNILLHNFTCDYWLKTAMQALFEEKYIHISHMFVCLLRHGNWQQGFSKTLGEINRHLLPGMYCLSERGYH